MATEHVNVGAAAKIPVPEASPIVSYVPLTIPSPGRPVDLQVRVTLPATGDNLPIILLSHGHGPSNWLSSHEGYAPLYEFWAKHGFVVILPTHLSSRALGLPWKAGEELHWKSRATDFTTILDNLDLIENSVPGLKGRLDKSKVAAAGHSFGGMTVSLLLGATNTDPRDGSVFRPYEPRIKAGVLFGATGNGGADLSEMSGKIVPFYGMDFSTMQTPTLTLGGDIDVSPHLTVRGADWHWDPYTHSKAPKALVKVKDGHHGFGGISGWDSGETQDEKPERLALSQRMSWAYMKSQLYPGDKSWERACEALAALPELGSVEA